MKTFLKGLFQDVFGRLAPVALVLSTSVLGIFIFLSKEDGDEKYSVHLAVLLAETLKFIVSLFVITFIDSSPTPSLPSTTTPTKTPTTPTPTPTPTITPTTTTTNVKNIGEKFKNMLPYAIPASIYAIDNTLNFLLLEYFSPPVLMVLQNIKVLVTGFVYTLVFKKQLSWVQWLSLISVTLGIVLIGFRRPPSSSPPSLPPSLSSSPMPSPSPSSFSPSPSFSSSFSSSSSSSSPPPPPPPPPSHPPLIGFLLLLSASLLASFGNVFCEKLLKGGDKEGLSLSEQNLRLYFFGIIFNLFWTWANDEHQMREKGIFHDFNIFVVLSVVCMAVVGLLISVVFKYLTSIVQVLCSVVSAFLVSIISISIGVFEPTEFFVTGSILIFSGVFLYANPTVLEKLATFMTT